MAFEYIKENLRAVNDKIAMAVEKSGRSPREITLVAVSKTHQAEALKVAVDFGATDLGEARMQEAEPKILSLGGIARWHMIGHLQTNKVKKAIGLFDLIQSVDSLKLAEEIDRRAVEINKKIDCLIEVNSSGEESKYGVSPDKLMELLERANRLENINTVGIMTIGPFVKDESLIRGVFRQTGDLFRRGQELIGDSFKTLSMGMSDDFEIAIEEGSNMIRVGTAIFGRREV